MDLPANLLPTLRAALARMIPEDQDPGALALGCEAFLLELDLDLYDLYDLYVLSLTALKAEGFEELPPEEQDALLREHVTFAESLAAHAMEAAYTHPDGLKMVGFEVTA